MRALVFLLKLLLKIVMVPVILALTLFVWICVGIVYVSGLVLGLDQHDGCTVGCGGSADLFPAKRHYPAGDGIPY